MKNPRRRKMLRGKKKSKRNSKHEEKTLIHSIPIYFGQRLADPADGQVVFTLNIKSDDLKFLAEPQYGNEFYVTNEKNEDVKLAYSLAGVDRPAFTTSLAARIRGMFRSRNNSILESYGDVVLVINRQVVSEDIVVFSSDAKNLSSAAKSDRSNFRAFKGSNSKLAEHLRELKENGRSSASKSPRLMGLYFEARLLRALRPTDIEAIYLPIAADAIAINRARKIGQMLRIGTEA
jgi:hypothetical protein